MIFFYKIIQRFKGSTIKYSVRLSFTRLQTMAGQDEDNHWEKKIICGSQVW